MTHLVLVTMLMFAVLGVLGMGRACWIRAHDGSMTGKHKIERDIREETLQQEEAQEHWRRS